MPQGNDDGSGCVGWWPSTSLFIPEHPEDRSLTANEHEHDVLRLHPELAVLPSSPPRVWHARDGWSDEVEPPEVADLLRAFVAPRPVGAVVAELTASHAGATAASIDRAVADLRARGVLLASDAAAWPSGRGLFEAPRRSLAEVLAHGTDVAALGVPYDAGATHRGGSRHAADLLRRAGGTCFPYVEGADGRALGVHDPVAGRRLLAGISIADLGDLPATAPVRNGPVLDRLRTTVAHLSSAGTFPLVLGGDHSVALPTVLGQADAYGRIGVIQLDAHTDRGATDGDDWRDHAHHANFVSWLLADDRVAQVVQLGVRQREPRPPADDPRVTVWPGRHVVEVDVEELLADLPADLPWHVTLDVDGLDPSVLTATATPVPGGPDHHELGTVLAALAGQRKVVGLDVCELLDDAPVHEAMIVADLLVRVLDGALRR